MFVRSWDKSVSRNSVCYFHLGSIYQLPTIKWPHIPQTTTPISKAILRCTRTDILNTLRYNKYSESRILCKINVTDEVFWDRVLVAIFSTSHLLFINQKKKKKTQPKCAILCLAVGFKQTVAHDMKSSFKFILSGKTSLWVWVFQSPKAFHTLIY